MALWRTARALRVEGSSDGVCELRRLWAVDRLCVFVRLKSAVAAAEADRVGCLLGVGSWSSFRRGFISAWWMQHRKRD